MNLRRMWKNVLRGTFCLLFSSVYILEALAFDTFEHKYVGDKAWQEALHSPSLSQEALGSAKNALNFLVGDISTEDLAAESTSSLASEYFSEMLPLSFGDLSAFGGDFSGTPEELVTLLTDITIARLKNEKYREKHVASLYRLDPRFIATRRQWSNVCSWIRTIRTTEGTPKSTTLAKCIDAMLDGEDGRISEGLIKGSVTAFHQIAAQGYQSSRQELAEFEKLKAYASIAADNRQHFATYSWEHYGKYHQSAIKFAECFAAQRNAPKPAIDCLVMAIAHEGFAQHFLQDSLSSGHMGSSYGFCLIPVIVPLLCLPSKDYLQHTHDELNRIGLRVEAMRPIETTAPAVAGSKASHLQKILAEGWTAYGDRHLLTPEAALHRHIVIAFAVTSLSEVLQASDGNQTSCSLCAKGTLPIPHAYVDATVGGDISGRFMDAYPLLSSFDLDMRREVDERVSPQSFEGWKFQVGYGNLVKVRPPQSLSQGGGIEAAVSATTYEIGYLRSTRWWIPNYLGAGMLYSPQVISVYPISIGYWGNIFRIISDAFGIQNRAQVFDGMPLIMGFRLNAGFQTAEPFSKFNPNSTRSVQGELSGVIDTRLQIYGPIGFYIRSEFVRATVSNSRWEFGSGIGGGVISTIFGLSIDLAGIL